MKLETERLILRYWNEADINDLIEGLNNINISQWLAFVPNPYTRNDAKNWINYCIQYSSNDNNKTYEFAIELKSEKKIIGGVTLNKIKFVQGTAGGGIWINESYHGRGYGAEAFGERIRLAFEKLNLRRLENGCFEGNQSSLKMQKKFGYRIEGLRRKAVYCMADRQFKNEYITGLLKDEWIKGV